MPDGWRWDDTLFRGSAAHYERGRLPYAPGYAETLAAHLGLDGRGRLLDVGCGPGTVTRRLAPFFREAVGLDPDTDMLAEAERRGAAGTRWVAGRAEDLPAGLGRFRTVVFAQSFHWTDRERVAATVRRMLEPGGAVVHIADLPDPPPATAPLPRPAPPYDRIAALVRRHLGPLRRAGRGVLVNGTPDGEDRVMSGAGLVGSRRLVVPAGQVVTRTADDLVAWTFSRSDSAPHLFGDRLAAFETELRALLSGGPYAEHLRPTEIMIWQAPDP
ncbi:class I SAM-dependent methyltransferase [Actinoplanes teichomyceticus]|uniref:Methyltransferase family protein n=1 Tax=Actinoplanes teichomyceticus TaxID=1867 RepID=A0A561W9E3_ACTTI|nr:class I SAM-dependent methyltransferase [Actinoplanes teichomyceticus]TWG20484.1 methyltransferase family protein [Actinoplanes teichomyceticus]GIF14030.1 methyltransferase [Actinoplanes teichomyceticus]